MRLRILADENIATSVIQALRGAGFDVVSIREEMPGANDADVLSRAAAERRLLITHDKDFGEMAFRNGLPADCGVVLFRLSGEDPDSDNRLIAGALASRSDWLGHFSIIDDRKIRMRILPGPVSRK